MTVFNFTPYDFRTNIADNYKTFNPETDENGVYIGDGSELTPDRTKLYYCSVDEKAVGYDRTKENKYYTIEGDRFLKDGKWYESKKDIDISYGADYFNGTVYISDIPKIFNVREVAESVAISRIEKTVTEIEGQMPDADGNLVDVTSTETSTPTYTLGDESITYTEQSEARMTKEGYAVDKATYRNVSATESIEISRILIKEEARANVAIRDINYKIGDVAEILEEDDRILVTRIVVPPTFPSVEDETLFKKLSDTDYIATAVFYDLAPSHRAIVADSKNYNAYIQEGKTIFDNIIPESECTGLFLGNCVGDTVNIYNDDVLIYTRNIIGKAPMFFDIKDVAINNGLKVELLGESTGVGTLALGNEFFIGAKKFSHSLTPHDTSVYVEEKGGAISFKKGTIVYDYNCVTVDYLVNKDDVLDVLQETGAKLCGFLLKDFDPNMGRYDVAIGRMLIDTIGEDGKSFTVNLTIRSLV